MICSTDVLVKVIIANFPSNVNLKNSKKIRYQNPLDLTEIKL